MTTKSVPSTSLSPASASRLRASSSLSFSTIDLPTSSPCAFRNVYVMPPPISSLSTRGSRFLMTSILPDTFEPPMIGDERPLRVAERVAQVVELLLHQVARRRLRHELRDALGRGVGAVGAAERVVHVDVGQRGQLLGEARDRSLPPRRGSAGSRAAARRRGCSAATAFSAGAPTQSSANATGAPSSAAERVGDRAQAHVGHALAVGTARGATSG